MVPPLARLPEARRLVEQGDYFVLHAPRQSGKTTLLRALSRALTAEGKLAALQFSGEMGEPMGDDYEAAQRSVLSDVRRRATVDLPSELQPPDPWPDAESGALVRAAFDAWARACPRPLVLLF